MTRVDPFEHLPKEIAGLIFDFIPEQRWRCMSVSRTWRNFILNIPVAHLAIDLRKWPLNPDSRRGLVLLLMTRPQSLSWMCSEASLCELVAMLNRAECFQLRKLVIKDRYHDRDLDRYVKHQQPLYISYNAVFIENCTRISRHLTHLDISGGYWSKNLIDFILNACPKLTYLSFQHTGVYNSPYLPQYRLSTATQPTDLLHLRWQGDFYFFSDPRFPILCPRLEILELLHDRTWMDSYSWQIRSGHLLKNIESLVRLVHFTCFGGLSELPQPAIPSHCTTPGLRNLGLLIPSAMGVDNLLDILTRNKTTLEFVFYEQLEYFDEEMDVPDQQPIPDNGQDMRLSRLTFPVLRYLEIRRLRQFPLHSFLFCCPDLENLKLVFMPLTPEIMDHFYTEPWQHLTLRYCSGDMENILSRFIQIALAHGADCSLKNITLVNNNYSYWMDIQRQLPYLGLISTVEEIHLQGGAEVVYRNVDTTYLEQFSRNAVQSGLANSLRKLQLGNDVILSDHTAIRLLLMNSIAVAAKRRPAEIEEWIPPFDSCI